jgi:hypothetical protein
LCGFREHIPGSGLLGVGVRARTRAFVAERFAADGEFEIFVRDTFDTTHPDVARGVPCDKALDEQVDAFLRKVKGRGLLKAFWQAFRQERPNFKEEIDALEASWASALVLLPDPPDPMGLSIIGIATLALIGLGWRLLIPGPTTVRLPEGIGAEHAVPTPRDAAAWTEDSVLEFSGAHDAQCAITFGSQPGWLKEPPGPAGHYKQQTHKFSCAGEALDLSAVEAAFYVVSVQATTPDTLGVYFSEAGYDELQPDIGAMDRAWWVGEQPPAWLAHQALSTDRLQPVEVALPALPLKLALEFNGDKLVCSSSAPATFFLSRSEPASMPPYQAGPMATLYEMDRPLPGRWWCGATAADGRTGQASLEVPCGVEVTFAQSRFAEEWKAGTLYKFASDAKASPTIAIDIHPQSAMLRVEFWAGSTYNPRAVGPINAGEARATFTGVWDGLGEAPQLKPEPFFQFRAGMPEEVTLDSIRPTLQRMMKRAEASIQTWCNKLGRTQP